MKLTQQTIERIWKQAQEEWNPIARSGIGQAYLRYDSMTVSRTKDGGTRVTFCYQGKDVAYLDADCDFARGDSLTITGIEGRQQLTCT